MQGLARFSLVAVIILAAVLLGAWAYLTARYGGVEQFLASDDAPRYWRPSRGSEIPDDEPPADDPRSLTERVAGEVKRGDIPDDSRRDWKPVEPEAKRSSSAEGAPAAKQPPALEARIETDFSELAIETEEESFAVRGTHASLKPFFARTRPAVESRWGFTSEGFAAAFVGKSSSEQLAITEMRNAGFAFVRGKVVDDQKLKGLENVVVAVIRRDGTPTHARAVSNRNGEFAVALPPVELEQCDVSPRRAKLCVIADGWAPAGARKQPMTVDSETDSNGLHQIKLKKTRGLRIRVRVDNRSIAQQPVRLWCELRDETGPMFDDHIFMSVAVPPRGDVVFRFPCVGVGTIRVGASGADCALDAIERENTDKDVLALRVSLMGARTVLCAGVVCGQWHQSGAAGAGIGAARVAAAGSTDITYTDSDGRFELYARKTADVPQLRITTVNGFDRRYDLRIVQRSEEDTALVRATVNNDGSHDWQLLAPVELELDVEIQEAGDEAERDRLTLVCVPPMLDGAAEKWWPLLISARHPRLVGFAKAAARFRFARAPWGSTVFVALRRSRSTGQLEMAGTFRCDAARWESPRVTVGYDGDGRSVVSLEIATTRR